MNANAGVISQQGKGSQFWMELPKKKGAGMNDFLSTLLRVDDDTNNVMLFGCAKDKSKLAPPLQVMDGDEAPIARLFDRSQDVERNRRPLPRPFAARLEIAGHIRFRSPDVLCQEAGIKHALTSILTSSQASTDTRRADDSGANP